MSKINVNPFTDNQDEIEQKKIEAVESKFGFAAEKPKRTPRNNGYNLGPKSHVNIAMPNPVYDRFLKYAQEHQLTYWKAIEKLLTETGN